MCLAACRRISRPCFSLSGILTGSFHLIPSALLGFSHDTFRCSSPIGVCRSIASLSLRSGRERSTPTGTTGRSRAIAFDEINTLGFEKNPTGQLVRRTRRNSSSRPRTTLKHARPKTSYRPNPSIKCKTWTAHRWSERSRSSPPHSSKPRPINLLTIFKEWQNLYVSIGNIVLRPLDSSASTNTSF